MNINQAFIVEVVDNFYGVLSARKDLCKISRSEHTVEFYKKHAYQELYALRFIPAYYFEYCVLAEELYGHVKGNYTQLNIASFGCGLSPDYYALRDNLNEVKFTYRGYDAVEWSSQKHMPKTAKNHQFTFECVQKIKQDELENMDVFVFPKSIGDIRNSGDKVIETLADKIAATKKDKIFFLNSYVTRSLNKPIDLKDFGAIHSAMLMAGFKTTDDPNRTYYRHDGVTKDKPIGLRKIEYEFVYPPGKKITCDHKDDADEICNLCIVPKNPIFTNQYMSFQLLEYTKK
ncbi:MAG: hypothetical protein WAW02_06720 [Sideroxyarcus sp.]